MLLSHSNGSGRVTGFLPVPSAFQPQIGLVKEEAVNSLSTSIYTDVNETQILLAYLCQIPLLGYPLFVRYEVIISLLNTAKPLMLYKAIFSISSLSYKESTIYQNDLKYFTAQGEAFCVATTMSPPKCSVNKWTHLCSWNQGYFKIILRRKAINEKGNCHGKVTLWLKNITT